MLDLVISTRPVPSSHTPAANWDSLSLTVLSMILTTTPGDSSATPPPPPPPGSSLASLEVTPTRVSVSVLVSSLAVPPP